MRWLLFVLLFPLASQAIEPVARIIGGQLAEQDRWPWMVSIGIAADETDYNAMDSHFCGGTLLANGWVLTAAHCVRLRYADELVVHVGEVDLKQVPWHQRQLVRRVFIHPDFDPETLDNDVALLELKDEMIWPQVSVGLLSDQVLSNFAPPLTILGWGDADPGDGQQPPAGLNHAKLEYLSAEVCADFFPGRLTDNMMCTYSPGIDACRGDSGGPLLIEVDGEWMQLGIISWGPVCGSAPYPGVYTRLQSGYLEWIDEAMAGRSIAVSESLEEELRFIAEQDDSDDGGGGGSSSLGMISLLALLLLRRRG